MAKAAALVYSVGVTKCYFLIDYENVNYARLEGTEFLERSDMITFFFSKGSEKIVGYHMMDIEKSGCAFEICKLKNTRKMYWIFT